MQFVSILTFMFMYIYEEWATDDVLFYTTLEGLSSSCVFRLDLASEGSGKVTSVYEETQPECVLALCQVNRLPSVK